MNWAIIVPWYRRWSVGDRWPNKYSRYLFQCEVLGHHVLVERHKLGCTCSYCRGEHGHRLLWLPEDKSRHSWRVLNFFHKIYIRWTL